MASGNRYAHTARIIRVGTENTVFQHLEVLKRNRNKRHRYQEFLVEGVRAINQARTHRWRIKALVYAASRPLSPWAREMLARAGADELIELRPDLMEQLSERDDTSELIAVVRMPPDDLARLRQGSNSLVVVFDRPNSPGNMGALIRSCAALGAQGLIVTGHGADLYHPQTVRGSMGSLFALPAIRLASHREVERWLAGLPAGDRPQIVGGSSDAACLPYQVDFTGPTVLVVGNETRGLSSAYRALCDILVGVPMAGSVDSLNVACAASILLYEADRQRRAQGCQPEGSSER
jgi:TrmH family RNA methyltransferase